MEFMRLKIDKITASKHVEEKLLLSSQQRHFYWRIYAAYCLPRPDPFPQFEPSYLETIDIEVLHGFVPLLERWFADRRSGFDTNMHVLPDSIMIVVIEEGGQSCHLDLANVFLDQLKDVAYIAEAPKPPVLKPAVLVPSQRPVTWSVWDLQDDFEDSEELSLDFSGFSSS